jgi:hypothetical protein
MGPGIAPLLYTVVACWGICAILAIPNLMMIASICMNQRTRMIHLGIYMLCVMLSITLFNGGFDRSFLTVALAAFGIPFVVACQFVSLLILRRRVRETNRERETKKDDP